MLGLGVGYVCRDPDLDSYKTATMFFSFGILIFSLRNTPGACGSNCAGSGCIRVPVPHR
jgi:hypothetical protein